MILAGNSKLHNFLMRMPRSIRSNAFPYSKRIDLTVDPLPSVSVVQWWIILSRAMVVEDFWTAPYWLQSRTFIVAGLIKSKYNNVLSNC